VLTVLINYNDDLVNDFKVRSQHYSTRNNPQMTMIINSETPGINRLVMDDSRFMEGSERPILTQPDVVWGQVVNAL
jgi:hypothetical protein